MEKIENRNIYFRTNGGVVKKIKCRDAFNAWVNAHGGDRRFLDDLKGVSSQHVDMGNTGIILYLMERYGADIPNDESDEYYQDWLYDNHSFRYMLKKYLNGLPDYIKEGEKDYGFWGTYIGGLTILFLVCFGLFLFANILKFLNII